jgi:hypothetical protein
MTGSAAGEATRKGRQAMNTKGLAKLYDRLTPAERLPLIIAAAERGDDAERDRLVNAAGRITLSMSDHLPYARAFDELATLIFLELLEDAGNYFDAGSIPEKGPSEHPWIE